MAEVRSCYYMHALGWSELLLDDALCMFAWEFLLRGYILFRLEKSIGKSAIFGQAIPFVLLHLATPFLETLFCIPGGFILGYVA
jgi:membrane protease YdiL (CAAX protease family)